MSEAQDVRVAQGPRRCAFCHEDAPAEERVACASCFAAHHAECWREAGRCATCQSPEALTREGQGPLQVAVAPERDPAATANALFPALGYADAGRPLEGVVVYTRDRQAMVSAAGEGFTDCWVVVGPEVADAAAACAAARAWIEARTFQRFWHYLTREPVVNFVVITDRAGEGLPAPSRTRKLFSALIYTVTQHSPKTGATRTQTTWTGSVAAQRTLAALRYALEQGVLPKDGAALGQDVVPGARLGQMLALLVVLAIVAVALLGVLLNLVLRH